MYTLHIANKNYSSWSLRPWILLRALQIPFEEALHPFSPQGNWDSFRQFTPTGKVPCLDDAGTVVWDSLAITEYIAEANPAVWPTDKEARAWARCASAEMHSGFAHLRNQCGMTCGHRIKLRCINADLKEDLDRLDELWCEGLSRFGGPFLAGTNFTAVDAFFAPVILRIQAYSLPLSLHANTYYEHMLAQPALREWYDAALGETWRDAAHEADILGAGELIADLRR